MRQQQKYTHRKYNERERERERCQIKRQNDGTASTNSYQAIRTGAKVSPERTLRIELVVLGMEASDRAAKNAASQGLHIPLARQHWSEELFGGEKTDRPDYAFYVRCQQTHLIDGQILGPTPATLVGCFVPYANEQKQQFSSQFSFG